jgi:predicted Zn finger-like uncharacterized protein
MFTVCPKCALTLVVTAADLRVAQGYVRCGRCSSVFNALARLSDERQSGADSAAAEGVAASQPADSAQDVPAEPTPAAAEPAATDATPADVSPEEDAIPDVALEFDPTSTDVSTVFVVPPPDPQWTAATGSFRAMVAATLEETPEEPAAQDVEVEIDAAFLAAMLRSAEPAAANPTPAADQTPAPSGVQQPAAGPPAAPSVPLARAAARGSPAPRHATPHSGPPLVAAAHVPSGAPRAQQALQAAEAEARAAAHEDDDDNETAAVTALTHLQRVQPYLWRTGAALAALLLLAQIVNHYRDELAATTRFNRPLTALYAALGVQLVPRWDLRAYDVRQLGASVDTSGAGLITVRASIKNAARQPQPLPLLRVTLQDRFGNHIASRDVPPRSYLPRAVPATSLLSGGQRIDAEMGFVDPGASAVGFEIDACLPLAGGAVTCANDVSAR